MFFETFVFISATSMSGVVNYIIYDYFYNQDDFIIEMKNKKRIQEIKELKMKRLKENDDLMKLLEEDSI